MELPEEYLIQMNELLKEDYPAFRDSFLELPVHGLRVNENRISCRELSELFEREGLPKLDGIPWIRNGFYTDGSAVYSKSPFYHAGLYYIQEPSAMTPAANLPIRKNAFVLDLCAAPGGKSTELLARLGGTGFLLSNDISAGRASVLKKNIEMSGSWNAAVSAESPEHLSDFYPEYFDFILTDVPCSGEGMFRRDPSMIRYWKEKGPSYYVPVQRGILESAYSMLRPGGYLMYSTCTFSVEENEENILNFLSAHQDISLCEIPFSDGFCQGVCKGTERCVRLYPHHLGGEGQFFALLKKDGILPERESLSFERICRNDEIYDVPHGFLLPSSLRFLMTGLHLGTKRKGRLIPSQAFAMSAAAHDWPKKLNLAAGDARVMKYLRGETIEGGSCKENKKAVSDFPEEMDFREILVETEGYPLGFALPNGVLLKNMRHPGWRIL